MYFGIKSHQLSLTTFGIQSLIEILSAALVLFRFNVDAKSSDAKVYARERYGSRLIGVCLVLLAIFAAVDAALGLKARKGPDTSTYGIIVAGVSAAAMTLLWVLKQKAGTILDSSVMISDAKCSLMCMCLGLLVVVSSVLYKLVDTLWWIDYVCAILLALRFVRDGAKIVRNTYREDFAGGCG